MADKAECKPGLSIPVPYVLIKPGDDPVDIDIRLTVQAAGKNGELRLFAHVARPAVKRRKKAGGARKP